MAIDPRLFTVTHWCNRGKGGLTKERLYVFPAALRRLLYAQQQDQHPHVMLLFAEWWLIDLFTGRRSLGRGSSRRERSRGV